MATDNKGYDNNTYNYAQIISAQGDGFHHTANTEGGWRNFNNLSLGTHIKALFTGDTNYKTNQNILQNNEIADKSKFVTDAKKSGMSQNDAENELKDIDKRTSTDAFTKQLPGTNQGGKYQRDYDNHNSIFNEFSDQAKKDQQVRADALTLYNHERDNKKDLYNGNALTHDQRAVKKGAEIDNNINNMFGMNKNGQSVGNTLSKYSNDNKSMLKHQNEKSLQKGQDNSKTNDGGGFSLN